MNSPLDAKSEQVKRFFTYLALERKVKPTVQDLPGHKDVRTAMVYTNVLRHGPLGVKSPADFLK